MSIENNKSIYFEKVSKSQFMKDCNKLNIVATDDNYNSIQIPTRATKGSAGYDICIPFDLEAKRNTYYTFPTGIRSAFTNDVFLAIVPKSGLGFKYQMRLANTIGIVDSDYYYSDNEGHIMVKFSAEKPFTLHKGDKLCQAIFIPFLITSDDSASGIRNGGFGSTGN